MEKFYPSDFITKQAQQNIALGMIEGHRENWAAPEEYLLRVEAGIEPPMPLFPSNPTTLAQLCQYVCQYWTHIKHAPTPDHAPNALEEARDRQAYLQSLDA